MTLDIPPRRRGIYLLPNLFTTGGLFGGFSPSSPPRRAVRQTACVAIFISAILDGIDGRVAPDQYQQRIRRAGPTRSPTW